MDDAVQDYIENTQPEHRPLFDRLHGLILVEHPGADVVLPYEIPTHKAGKHRLCRLDAVLAALASPGALTRRD